jgi:hypothetical protein
MSKKKIVKKILSSKVKIDNYLKNEKVEAINVITNHAFERKLISVNA